MICVYPVPIHFAFALPEHFLLEVALPCCLLCPYSMCPSGACAEVFIPVLIDYPFHGFGKCNCLLSITPNSNSFALAVPFFFCCLRNGILKASSPYFPGVPLIAIIEISILPSHVLPKGTASFFASLKDWGQALHQQPRLSLVPDPSSNYFFFREVLLWDSFMLFHLTGWLSCLFIGPLA